ncbi:ORC-CDC6 family AAA ATPase [Clavibacter seminis]|uniref:ORC-CDC6 family AAA ATPase n=1 Tax=Clavibacter TaxID=1573 RepID=UPI00402AAF65
MKTVQSDVFAAANARFRSASMVAETFVPPEQFKTLTRPSHTIMVGPRGSGKTTLLKMLTPEALEAASKAKRFKLSRGITFTGIFIPSDIAWNRQVAVLEESDIPTEVAEGLFEASFTASVLRSFATSLHERFTRSVPQVWLNLPTLTMSQDVEESLVRDLARVWHLELHVPSFLGLRAAASERIVAVGALAATMHRSHDFTGLDSLSTGSGLIPAITTALDTLEAHVPALVGEKWCMLFDELELAPLEVRRSLIASMRSVDDRLIFKLAISPYSADLSDLVSSLGAMAGHDHEEIWLSYGHKQDALRFTFDLMSEVIRERLGQNASVESMLGEAVFTAELENENLDDGASRASTDEYVSDLYDSDASFRDYVNEAVGDLPSLLSSEGQKRAQHYRKVMPLVITRLAFRTPDDSESSGTRRYRSRKNPDIYAGANALAAILEGNPRWIIGVMNTLLDSGPGRIETHVQAAEVTRTRNRFRALLSTIPVPLDSKDTRKGLLWLIDQLGAAFRKNVIADDFTPDPVGTFIVDRGASDALLEALGSAVNTGALVYVPDSDSSGLLTSMRGKRLRLSYLLATGYQLPLGLQRGASMRSVLGRIQTPNQLELFDDL